MNNILEELEKIAGKKNVLTKEPMKKHTTFRTGGEADYFVTVQEENVLPELRTYLEKNKIPYYVIGNGSNLLFPDEGYAGVIIQIGRFPDDIRISDTAVTAGAGVKLSLLANRAYQAGLTGMEFAAGIPGTVGGAVVMNAGAYGDEMKDILVQAKVMDAQGNIFRLSRDELDLSYRHSIIPEKAFIVLEADFLLQHGNPEEIKAVMNALAAKRREKQPLEYASAGSTFKRPEGYFAGKLIQDAGLKGFSVGDAQVSEKHSGFVINRGNATTQDILTLVQEVQEKVFQDFGVKLEMEVKVVK